MTADWEIVSLFNEGRQFRVAYFTSGNWRWDIGPRKGRRCVNDKTKRVQYGLEKCRSLMGLKGIKKVSTPVDKSHDSRLAVAREHGQWSGANDVDPFYEPTDHDLQHRSFVPYEGDEDVRELVRSFPEELKGAHEWVLQSLSRKEMDSLRKYTGGSFSASINSRMKDCPETLDCLEEEIAEHASNISNAIRKAGKLTTPITVFRGVSSYKPGATREMLATMLHAKETGKTVILTGFQSCSLDPGKAAIFTSTDDLEGRVLLEIRAKSGLLVSFNEYELEWLMNHDAKYKVLDVKKIKYGPNKTPVMTVILEEIDDEDFFDYEQ